MVGSSSLPLPRGEWVPDAPRAWRRLCIPMRVTVVQCRVPEGANAGSSGDRRNGERCTILAGEQLVRPRRIRTEEPLVLRVHDEWHTALDVLPSSIGPYSSCVFRLRTTSMKFCMWRSSPLNSFTTLPLLSTALAVKYCVVITLPPSQSITLP